MKTLQIYYNIEKINLQSVYQCCEIHVGKSLKRITLYCSFIYFRWLRVNLFWIGQNGDAR